MLYMACSGWLDSSLSDSISTLIGLVNFSVRDGVFVTISASYDTWIDNPSLASIVDVTFLKSHQYWQGYSVDDAIDVAFELIKNQIIETTYYVWIVMRYPTNYLIRN